jgi:hypothetical protein
MFDRTNWAWVRDWTQKIAGTAFLLICFGLLASGNVMRPGGVVESLPTIILYAVIATVPVALVTLLALASYSHKQGGRHDS